jgi:carbon storage regulator CsrA
MLILSRKEGESIEIPELGIVIQVASIKKSRVALSIEAPRELAILRGELVDAVEKSDSFALPSAPAQLVEEPTTGYRLSTSTDPGLFQVA